MQAVGELDQQHAHVIDDGQEKLAQVLSLLGFLGDEVELFQLGEAFDERADILAEQLIDLGTRRGGVFDRVVQQRRGDGGVVELEVGQDRGDFNRMREVRIARGAALIAMRLHRVDIGAVEQRLVGVRIIGTDALDQIVLPHHLRLAGGGLLGGRYRAGGWRGWLQRGPGRSLLLHAREVGARARCHNKPQYRRGRSQGPRRSWNMTSPGGCLNWGKIMLDQ